MEIEADQAAEEAKMCAEIEDCERIAAESEMREPPVGSYASVARMMAEMGIMSGDEADDWKDRMKDEMFDDEPNQSAFMGER